MPSLSLDQLYFGKDDAESDIARGGLLKQGFLRTRAYEAAFEGTKTLIIGRKGSGKSAISLILRNRLDSEGRVCLVTPDEISADEIRRFQLPGIPPEMSKHLIWRYIFDVQIAKYLITYAKRHNEYESHGELGVLRKFLIDNGEVDDLSFTEKFWRIVERLKGSVSVEAFTVKLKTEVEHQLPGIQTSHKLDTIEDRLLAAAKALKLDAESEPFHILVDQIEKVWSNDRESDAMVVGLLLASKHIRRIFEFVICTLFVRTDIYEKLQFQDRDHFRGDEFHIDWDKQTLLELILARATASCGRQVNENELWESIFPKQIGEDAIQAFLVGRTLMRPRDIIQLCNACRDKARTNGHASITETDINDAMSLYSNWKLSDLQNEWSINFPFLADLFVLFSNSTYVVRRQAFEDTFNIIKPDLIARYPTLGNTATADKILSNLYSIGFIGVVNGGATRYFYQANNERRIEPRDTEFIVHPCFRNALQSTSALALVPFSRLEAGDLILERFLAEERRGLSFDAHRPSRSLRGLSYVEDGLEQLRIVMLKSTFPDEVRTEVLDTVKAMQRDIATAVEVGEPKLVGRTTERIFRHLTVLRQKLIDHQWLISDRQLDYTLEEVCRRMEKLRFGDLPDIG